MIHSRFRWRAVLITLSFIWGLAFFAPCTLFATDTPPADTAPNFANAFGLGASPQGETSPQQGEKNALQDSTPQVRITGRWEEAGGDDGIELILYFELPEHIKIFGTPHQRPRIESPALKDVELVEAPALDADGYAVRSCAWHYRAELVEGAALLGCKALPISIAFQMCSKEGVCYTPTTVSAGIAHGSLADFSKSFAPEIGQQQALEAPKGSLLAEGQQSGWLLMLLFAFLGGLLLNLMPCVLPAIGIKLAAMLGASDSCQERRDSRIFALGMFIFIFALGLLTALLRLAGQKIGWGFQFQSPLFSMAMITLIVCFALSFFGFFTVGNFSISTQLAGKEGHWWAPLTKGMLAAVLATPCSAPLLAPAVGYALSRGALEIILFFSVIGLGFALPLLLISTLVRLFGRRLSAYMPRSGAWMDILKAIMGFILLSVALYLMSFVIYQVSTWGFLCFLGYLLVLVAVLYAFRFVPFELQRRVLIVIAVLAIIVGVAIFASLGIKDSAAKAGSSSSEKVAVQDIPEGWQSYSPERFAALQEAKKPHLLVVSAAWCSICKTNNRKVLYTKEAKEILEQKNILVLYADYTNKNAEIAQVLEQFKHAGVPLYAYFDGERYRKLPQQLDLSDLQKL